MTHDGVDENIAVGYYDEQSNTYLDFTIHILEADSATTPRIFQLDKHIQWIICGICWAFVIIGTYFRYLLYSFLFDSYKSKESKPIDTLIYIISLIKKINILILVTSLT